MSHWTEQLFVENPQRFERFQENRIEAATEEVGDLCQLLAEEYGHEPETVLDVGCGIGRHVLEFADHGLAVTGIDISPDYLDRARTRATEAGLENRTTFIEADMRSLETVEESFDLVTSFWNSVGYFEADENLAVFEGMYESLAPDGIAVIELSNRDAILSEYREHGSVNLVGDEVHAQRFEYDPETARMETTLYLLDTASESFTETLTWDQRLYAPVELRRLLDRVGFETVELYSSFDGQPLDRTSTPMIVIARRATTASL